MSTNHNQKNVKDRAALTLLESLGAVQNALSALPEAAPRNLREAFTLSDPILSMLDKQLVDARSQLAHLAAVYGIGDAMAEAMHTQITAIEAAYAQRMAALRKKREERERQTVNDTSYTKDCAKIFMPEKQVTKRKRENDNWLLLWAWTLMGDRRKASPPVLKTA